MYSQKEKPRTIIDIFAGDTGFIPEKRKNYVLNGSFLDTTRTAFQIGDYPMNGLDVFRVESFFETKDLSYNDYVDEGGIPEAFVSAAEQYRKERVAVIYQDFRLWHPGLWPTKTATVWS